MAAGHKGEKRQMATVVYASVFCAMLKTESKKRADNGAVALVMGRRQ